MSMPTPWTCAPWWTSTRASEGRRTQVEGPCLHPMPNVSHWGMVDSKHKSRALAPFFLAAS